MNCDNKCREENQLEVTVGFIALMIRSTFFRALLCPSSGALDYMYDIAFSGVQCLTAGCRGSGAGQQAMCPERRMLHDCSRATSLFLDTHIV